MSDTATSLPEGGRRRLSTGMAVALATALLAGPGLAQGAPAKPAVAAPARAVPGTVPAKPAPVPKPKTPRQMADEIIPILSRQKTPWQLYPTYQQIFSEFAAKEAALAVAGNPNDSHAKLAQHLQAMAALLNTMGEQAKLREDIKRGRSTLPPEERQSSFLAAGNEHGRLLTEFSRLAALLPQAKPQPAPGTPAPATR